MSVPSSVAASTAQNVENGTSTTASVDLEVTTENENVDLEVPFSTNSGGNVSAIFQSMSLNVLQVN